MFANFIYFIIVLLIYSTYQPVDHPRLPAFDALVLFLGFALLFAYYTGWLFRRFRRRFAHDVFVRADHRFNLLLTRQSVMAIVVFGVDVYGLDLPAYLNGLPPFSIIPTLLALLFLGIFIAYQAVVWYAAHGAYRALYATGVSRPAYVWSQISFAIPVLLPWLCLSGIADIINALPFSLPKRLLATTQGEAAYFMVFLLATAMLGPAMIQRFWRCKPMENGYARHRIETLCQKAGMAYANILYWPIFGGRMITAGVMGLVKRFRYILVTQALLRYLEPEEIDAVIAHEIGHVKRKHLLFYLVFFAGYLLISYALFDLIVYAVIFVEPLFRFFTGLGIDPATMTSVFFSVVLVMLFLIYFRFIFGYFMRNFERQADCYVYALFESARPLISTLEKIALHSGQPADRPNWHHFSITERINYLARCETDRSAVTAHDRKIRNSIAVYLLGILAIGAVGYSLNYGETGRRLSNHFFETVVLREIERRPDDPKLYRILGDLYYNADNFAGVKKAYEKSLDLYPDNPHVLNNLAWLYATSEDPEYRDPSKALMLAKAAAALLEEPHILDTLAESYYANGMHDQAVRTETRALRLARENRAYYEEQLARFRQALEKGS